MHDSSIGFDHSSVYNVEIRTILVCSAEVILGAFFDVELKALDYSLEEDGSVKLSEQPYLQVGFAHPLPNQPLPCPPHSSNQTIGLAFVLPSLRRPNP